MLATLARSGREYGVVLRSFGRDGETILPKRGPSWLMVMTVTIEQVVAKALRRSLNLDTYAFVDQDVLFAPPGPTYVRASNDDWKASAQRLICSAHSIVVILVPGRDSSEGFAWEIDQIVRSGLQSRVVIVLPPYDKDAHGHEDSRRQAGVLLGLLEPPDRAPVVTGTSTPGPMPALPKNTLVVRPGGRSGPRTWGPGGAGPLTVGQVQMEAVRRLLHWEPRRTSQPDATLHGPATRTKRLTEADYIGPLVEAIDAIDIELSELAFHEHGRDSYADEAIGALRSVEGNEGQAVLEAEHRHTLADNRARWGLEAPVRAEIRALNHRIRDREQGGRPTLGMTSWARFVSSCFLLASATASFAAGWFVFKSWLPGIAGLAYWVAAMLATRRTARRSLVSLYADRRELQSRLGCGIAGCERCHNEEDHPRNVRLPNQSLWHLS